MRQFGSGATRDDDAAKLDYEGFLSPIVLRRYAEYMHKHRVQADGRLRGADNWQRGIPRDAYIKSLLRHTHDLWLHHRGYSDEATDPSLIAVCCAIMFNIQGYLYEVATTERSARALSQRVLPEEPGPTTGSVT